MFFAFLVMKTNGILFFGPNLRKPAQKASSGEIYLKNNRSYNSYAVSVQSTARSLKYVCFRAQIEQRVFEGR